MTDARPTLPGLVYLGWMLSLTAAAGQSFAWQAHLELLAATAGDATLRS